MEPKYLLGPITVTEDMNDAAILSAVRLGFTLVWRVGGLQRDPCFDTDGKFCRR
jgi:hypothetical protein